MHDTQGAKLFNWCAERTRLLCVRYIYKLPCVFETTFFLRLKRQIDLDCSSSSSLIILGNNKLFSMHLSPPTWKGVGRKRNQPANDDSAGLANTPFAPRRRREAVRAYTWSVSSPICWRLWKIPPEKKRERKEQLREYFLAAPKDPPWP
jgi:hypothetical protein